MRWTVCEALNPQGHRSSGNRSRQGQRASKAKGPRQPCFCPGGSGVGSLPARVSPAPCLSPVPCPQLPVPFPCLELRKNQEVLWRSPPLSCQAAPAVGELQCPLWNSLAVAFQPHGPGNQVWGGGRVVCLKKVKETGLK